MVQTGHPLNHTLLVPLNDALFGDASQPNGFFHAEVKTPEVKKGNEVRPRYIRPFQYTALAFKDFVVAVNVAPPAERIAATRYAFHSCHSKVMGLTSWVWTRCTNGKKHIKILLHRNKIMQFRPGATPLISSLATRKLYEASLLPTTSQNV